MLKHLSIYLSIYLSIASIITHNVVYAQCASPCTDLSMLAGTTAANSSILPGTSNMINLGSSSKQWANVYIGTKVLFAQQTTDAFIYYNGNKFINTVGGNNQSLYVGELAGGQVSDDPGDNNGCVGIGYSALFTLGDDGFRGNHNTAVGWRAMYFTNGDVSVDADKNTMVGSRAGESITSGQRNTGIGWDVFLNTGVTFITGTDNSALGSECGAVLEDGNYNTFVGSLAGSTTKSGSSNILIGYNALASSNIASNELNIGATLYGNLSSDRIGINVVAPAYTLDVAGDCNISSGSVFRVNGTPISASTLSNGITGSGTVVLATSPTITGTANLPIVTQTGKTTNYNNIATVANGIPSEYAEINLTNQGIGTTGTTIYTPPADGMYRISYTGRVTTVDVTSSMLRLEIKYTDPDGSVVVTWPGGNLTNINQTNLNTTQATISGSFCVYAKASTNIQYIVTYSSPGTGNLMRYNLHIRVEAI